MLQVRFRDPSQKVIVLKLKGKQFFDFRLDDCGSDVGVGQTLSGLRFLARVPFSLQ